MRASTVWEWFTHRAAMEMHCKLRTHRHSTHSIADQNAEKRKRKHLPRHFVGLSWLLPIARVCGTCRNTRSVANWACSSSQSPIDRRWRWFRPFGWPIARPLVPGRPESPFIFEGGLLQTSSLQTGPHCHFTWRSGTRSADVARISIPEVSECVWYGNEPGPDTGFGPPAGNQILGPRAPQPPCNLLRSASPGRQDLEAEEVFTLVGPSAASRSSSQPGRGVGTARGLSAFRARLWTFLRQRRRSALCDPRKRCAGIGLRIGTRCSGCCCSRTWS